METDGLLSNSSPPQKGRNKDHRCLIFSNWAVVFTLCIFIATLLTDIGLRVNSFRGESSPESTGTSPHGVSTSHGVISSTKLSSSSRYHATQFISFTINTLGGLAKYGECEDRNVDPKSNSCYLGTKDIETDVNHRLAIIEEILRTLKNDVFKEDPEIDRDPGVLKILMVPEFFLRGPNGAYSTSQLFDSENDEEDGVLIKLADRVRELIADVAFEDYLFVLGTVIAAESINTSNTKPWEEELADAEDVMYFNFAPVYRGGKDNGGSRSYVVLKQYISNADFLSRTKLPNPSDYDMHAYAKADKSKVLDETFAKRNVTLVTDNYFEVDGIKIGIEICLDHRMGALWNSLRINHKSSLVDVQLVTSAGMSIERGPNPLKPDGVVYLSDGEASSAACIRTDSSTFDPNHICRGKPDGLQHRPQGGPGYSNFVALSGCIDMEKSHLLKGYYSLHQPQGCANTLKMYGIDVMDEFKYYPPSLEVYPTIDLPIENENI